MRINRPAITAAVALATLLLASGALAQHDPAAAKLLVAEGNAALKALNEYLKLAPDGPHAADVKAMVDYLK